MNKSHKEPSRRTTNSIWKSVAICLLLTIAPWGFYVNFHPRLDQILTVPAEQHTSSQDSSHSLGQLRSDGSSSSGVPAVLNVPTKPNAIKPVPTDMKPVVVTVPAVKATQQLPVLGPVPTDGTKPLYGYEHKGTDAIFALACNYPKVFYQVSLRPMQSIDGRRFLTVLSVCCVLWSL